VTGAAGISRQREKVPQTETIQEGWVMPNFVHRRFWRPETFRKIRPDLLLAWLKQSESYFTSRRMFLPGSDEQLALPIEAEPDGNGGPPISGIDYDGLTRVFMEPTPDMPPALVDGLHLIHEMGSSRRLDMMLEEARINGLELGLGDDATPEDVAVKLLLLDTRVLENLHHCQEVMRPRSFQYFTTDANPVPAVPFPTLETLRELEQRLDAFYVAWGRGTGTRVFAYCQQRMWHCAPEWVFLVRHGAPFRREEAMEAGKPTAVLYRPRKYAVLKYDTGRGEMGVYCSSPREQKVLLRAFGACLFGRKDFFPGTAKFNLWPLVLSGRASLACMDVPGIEHVRLTDVEFYQRAEPWKRVIQQADDIFTLLERDEVRWPARIEEITRATFAVKFWRQKRPRRLSIVPCNRALYSRDEDSTILESWMAARSFIGDTE
jgi:hypothetical protein